MVQDNKIRWSEREEKKDKMDDGTGEGEGERVDKEEEGKVKNWMKQKD